MPELLHKIDLHKAGNLPALITDYVSGNTSVNHLAKYSFSISAFKNVIADKTANETDRKLLTDVLQTQYLNIPTSISVSNNIEALKTKNTFTVTAAHQPCLFLGPLYNIYKIACAISLCKQLKSAYPENNFVPVFWLGTEDHDVDELAHAYVNGKKIEWQNPGTGAGGRWKTASMQSAIDELKLVTPHSEIITLLEDGLKKYESFGHFTQYFVNEIFKEYGLVVLDGDDVRLKQKLSAVIKDEVLNSRAVLILKPTIDFLETNYKAQAKPRDINFFYLGENYRERIVLNPSTEKFEVNNTAISFSLNEMELEIESHPERFSPNVIYRPLYQETVLPNLAFIGGAGELSYWLELKSLFEYHNINYPVLALRNSAFVLTEGVQKKLDKLNLTAADFTGEPEQLINRFVQQSMDADLNLSAEKLKLEELFLSVSAKAETADVTLKQSAATEKQKVIASIENLEAKMLKAEKRKQETAVNQIRAIHSFLYPDNTLQERRENFIPFYTKEFIETVVEVCHFSF